jgi:hypothetical protein
MMWMLVLTQSFMSTSPILKKLASTSLSELELLNTILPLSMSKVDSTIDVSLVVLDDIETDGEWLASQITKWLDVEWIAQPVHMRIGAGCAQIYKKGRVEGIVDLGEMLIEMGTGLEQVDFDDKTGDAYVNAWDVANKVSDLLMLRMDRDLCACMGDMSIFSRSSTLSSLSANKLEEVASALASQFERYKWTASFLEGEEDKATIDAVCALMLGYRVDPSSMAVVYDEAVGAYGWQEECKQASPEALSLNDASNSDLSQRLQRDIPVDPEVTDIAVEPLAGAEVYKQMNDPLRAGPGDAHRVLLAKWLYVHNFITGDTFPAAEPFVPTNLVNEDDEEEDKE